MVKKHRDLRPGQRDKLWLVLPPVKYVVQNQWYGAEVRAKWAMHGRECTCGMETVSEVKDNTCSKFRVWETGGGRQVDRCANVRV